MSGRFLLDTNIVIALLRGEEAVYSHLEEDDELSVPSIVICEHYCPVKDFEKRFK